MSIVTVTEVEFGSWGNCVRVSNGTVEVLASVDFGPRIIRYGFVGGGNLFFEDTDRAISEAGDAFAVFGEKDWKIYGGHRLWTSPEASPRSYYPDHTPVKWTKTENGVILTPQEEKWTQVQKQIEMRMDAQSGEVTVTHRITNTGAWPVEFAVWALSVMAPGGTVVVPHASRAAGLLPNRVLSLWPYTKMNDPRVTWGEKYIVLRQAQGETPFKFGSNNEEGWAAYSLNGDVFVKTFPCIVGGNYPDYGVCFESYTNDYFLEIESLGELQAVKPGQTISHQETWNLHKGADFSQLDESALEQELGKLLK